MDLNNHLQNSIIKLLITDESFCKTVCCELDTSFFITPVARRIAQICISYYLNYKRAIGDHFQDEIYLYLKELDENSQNEYIDYIELLENVKPNKDYVINRLASFIKERVMENSVLKYAELVSDKKYDEAENYIYDILKQGIGKENQFEEYTNTFDDIYERRDGKVYLMKSGIDALDRLIGGYMRGKLVCWSGGYKGKKTWCLLHHAKQGLMTGLNVCYFSHEVDEEELKLRFDMMLSARGSDEQKVGKYVEYPIYNGSSIEAEQTLIRSVYDIEPIIKTRENARRFGGKVIFKKYPMGTCTIEEMERFLNYLEEYENFSCDLLITDYLDIMNISKYSSETRHQINEAYKHLKRIADERNILVMTASQVTSEALDKDKITMKQAAAEDRRKIGNVDMFLSISGSEEKEESNVGRITLLANRSGGNQGASCTFSHCLDIGQFCISSWIGEDLDNEMFSIFGQ